MRVLPAGMQDHLDSGATTLCHCWRVITTRGDAFGFTSHDRDLTFDGLTFEAEAGFSASDMETTLGLAVDNLEAAGALSSDRLSEARLLAGDFDNATIDVWLVNWQDVTQRVLLRSGNLGEVTAGPPGFTAELRGLAHRLNQPQGRLFQYGCDAVLGDQRCRADLDQPAFRADALVQSATGRDGFTVTGADSFSEGWFARGTATFSSGANAGRAGEVKFHRRAFGQVAIELWQPMAHEIAAGDAVVLRAGCDRQFATCKSKFNNALNFRGFPHIPGDDFVLGYATRGDPRNSGGSLSS